MKAKMYTYEDLKRINNQYDIFDVLKRVLPNQYQSGTSSNRGTFLCPLHNDSTTGNLITLGRSNICKCFAGCDINGKEYAGPIDVVMEFVPEVNTIWDAARWIENETLNTPIPRPKPKKTTSTFVSMKLAQKYHGEWARHMPYYMSRGLSEETIHEYLLGYKPNHKPRSITVDGQTIHRLPHGRFTIPHIVGDSYVKNIKFRLDLESARQTYTEYKNTANVKNAERIAREKAAFESDYPKLLVEYLFGPKYIAWGKVSDTIYNGRMSMDSRWIASFESELDALLFQQVTGIPAIAHHGSRYLHLVTDKCERVLIFPDQDDAGREYAAKTAERLIADYSILNVPHGKDFTEWYLQHKPSKQEILTWIHQVSS